MDDHFNSEKGAFLDLDKAQIEREMQSSLNNLTRAYDDIQSIYGYDFRLVGSSVEDTGQKLQSLVEKNKDLIPKLDSVIQTLGVYARQLSALGENYRPQYEHVRRQIRELAILIGKPIEDNA